MSGYRPVSCDLHSQYELAILRRERWRIDGVSDKGELQGLPGRPLGLITRSGEEFLQFEADSDERLEFRLDRIRGVVKVGETA